VALTTPCLLGEEAGVVMSLTSLSLALLGQVPEGIWYRPYTVEAVSVFHLKLTVLPGHRVSGLKEPPEAGSAQSTVTVVDGHDALGGGAGMMGERQGGPLAKAWALPTVEVCPQFPLGPEPPDTLTAVPEEYCCWRVRACVHPTTAPRTSAASKSWLFILLKR